MFHRLALSVLGLLVLGTGACVRYRPAVVHAPRTARSFPSAPSEPLAFEAAVRLLVERNAELRRLRAEAASVNLKPGPDALFFRTEIIDGNVNEMMIGTDILSLLGIGPRQAETALAHAVLSERVLLHHERARSLVAELAEAFAVDAVLRGLASPRPALDVDAFRTAGLASESSLAAAGAALVQAESEEAVVTALLADTRREIARLIAASPEAPALPVCAPPAWPSVPEPDEKALLYARGDLLRARGSFFVADQRLRLAVRNQWPNLGVFLGGNVYLERPMQAFLVRLPLAAPEQAKAMARERDAARLSYDERVLDAMHDAAGARLKLTSAEARARGAAARRAAAAALVKAATARVETEAERAFDAAVMAAVEEVRAATVYREAAVAAARARARAALAAGWPGVKDVEGLGS